MTEEFQEQITKRFCLCGCSREVKGFTHNKPYRPVEFVRGHHARLAYRDKNNNWRGGRKVTKRGYIVIKKRGHPRTDIEGYAFEHILVMEQKLGRPIQRYEVVHHINGIKDDNRPENLELIESQSVHATMHCHIRAISSGLS
jgi:HNH endonuclease